MPALITIAGLDFAYGQQLALKQITLPVEEGSTLGIIGPNGGGKTTLVRLILGLLEPTRGAITVAGLTPRQAVSAGNILGYLPQNYSTPENFPVSVRQVVRMGLVAKTGMLRPFARADLEYVEQLLERVGIHELADRPIWSLSGGQLQRTLIARALSPRPRILVLDEPTTGIDRVGQQRFIEFIHSLKQEMNLTVILISHDTRAVTAIADRIACLNVTLHYHDVPHKLTGDVMSRLFACDLHALGLDHELHAESGGGQ